MCPWQATRIENFRDSRRPTIIVAICNVPIADVKLGSDGQKANHTDPEWHGVETIDIEGAQIPINRYFLRHPEMVLGTWSRKDRLYDAGYSVDGNGDLAGQLREAVGRLPAFAPTQAAAD